MLCIGCFCNFFISYADDGSSLWLGYPETTCPVKISSHKPSPILQVADGELRRYWKGAPVKFVVSSRDRALRHLGKDGFRLEGNGDGITIFSSGETGILYGTYSLLRRQALGEDCTDFRIEQAPDFDLRILNHWDNLDGTIERGYAGHSLWQWQELPDVLSPRYESYARANASIGINGTVLNNVNASPDILRPAMLQKVRALADVFRPYGIRVYLSVNFSSPAVIGALPDSDPARPEVRRWWREKAAEIYRMIPDFGGFLVKANSEGQPGPQDYGRTHAEGANMLAEALKPHGGIVMWRAFVYAANDPDRAKLAYDEFVPLDGQFADNVIVQVKNGPIDFQPREPFSPLFGVMKQTPLMVEFQITQEYLGQGNHLVYLAPLFKECLDADTYRPQAGCSVAAWTDGTLSKGCSAIAGVANIGLDANWCGHDFAQANWYAFGRLAWDHSLTAETIASEWIAQTFPQMRGLPAADTLCLLMSDSREAAVDYMMPLGLHHIFATNHHYGPEPWFSDPTMRRDWQPPYYHQADTGGIGFDRTELSGSGATAQYATPLCKRFNDPRACPEEYLLWFHHVSWDFPMQDGTTLWETLCRRYQRGVGEVRRFQVIWDRLRPYVDAERHKAVRDKLMIQAHDAEWWRDACLQYFQEFSARPLPDDVERPVTPLENLKKIRLNMSHHN